MATTMKAVGIAQYGGPEVVSLGDWPKPSPGDGEVLIRVHAAGVNPLDWKVRDGSVRAFLSRTPPFIIGADVSGVVVAVGAGVGRHRVGDTVFGQVGLLGGYAEYAVTAETRVAQKPAGLSHAQAASLPISGMTAWQGLFEDGELQAGQRVLIHGGASGVGSFAVQMAHGAGATVIATASAGNAEFVHGLGADEVIDYRTQRFEDRVRDVDLVLDTQYGDVLARSWSVLKPGGRMVSTVGPPDPERAKSAGVTASFVIGAPDAEGRRIDRLATLIDTKRITTTIQQVFPLVRAGEALEISKAGHVRGKLVLSILDEPAA